MSYYVPKLISHERSHSKLHWIFMQEVAGSISGRTDARTVQNYSIGLKRENVEHTVYPPCDETRIL